MLADESGFMLQPVARKTWALRGRRPVHRSWDRHDRLSVLGALTVSPQRKRLGFYFWLRQDNVRTDDAVDFVMTLWRQLGRGLIVIWDRLSAHRAAAKIVEQLSGGAVEFEWLPAYAPELNPVEQVWSHTKYGELGNFIPEDIDDLRLAVSDSLGLKRHEQQLLQSFFQHSGLFL